MKSLASRLGVLAASSALIATATCASASAASAAPSAASLAHSHVFVPGHSVPGHVTPASRGGGTSGVQQSENWSGYVQTGSSGKFSKSTASWTVPSMSTKYKGYSSSWVGIDGDTDSYLIQTGTEADVVNGRASYDAWWEVITPTDEAPETLFTSLTIHPRDHITASVTKGTGGKWTMKLTDTSTGKSASHTSSFKGPGESAEWIQEDTDVNGYISAAPDWGSVSFSNITVNGVSPNLQYSQSMDIYDSHGTQEDSTGQPSGGNGFTVTWLATGTRTYVG